MEHNKVSKLIQIYNVHHCFECVCYMGNYQCTSSGLYKMGNVPIFFHHHCVNEEECNKLLFNEDIKTCKKDVRRFILIRTKCLSIFKKNDHEFYVYKINAKRILEFGIIEFPGKSGSHEQTKQLQKCSAIKQKWSILFR